MAALSVNERRTARRSRWTSEEKQYFREFLVEVSSANDMDVTAGLADLSGSGGGRVPSMGEQHPEDISARVNNIDPQQVEDAEGFWWIVRVSYSTSVPEQDDPLAEAAKYIWAGEAHQKALVKDRDDKAVLNSAGDPFDPPVPRDDSRPTVRISKNVSPLTVPNPMVYKDAINSDAIIIDGIAIAVKCAKIKWIEISEVQVRNDIFFRIVSIPVYVDDSTWELDVLDSGFRHLSLTKPVEISLGVFTHGLVPMVDEEGKTLASPGLLDGEGHQIRDPKPENAHFLAFGGYKLLPFSALPGVS